jgi:hypothetical protein
MSLVWQIAPLPTLFDLACTTWVPLFVEAFAIPVCYLKPAAYGRTESKPDEHFLRLTVYATHLAHLMSSFWNVVLTNADGAYPIKL